MRVNVYYFRRFSISNDLGVPSFQLRNLRSPLQK